MPTPTRVYAPGQDITTRATATVATNRFVSVSGNRVDGNIAVAHSAAGARPFGVSTHDAAAGEVLTVARGGVVRVQTSASISAGADVQASADGKVTTASTGAVIGTAVSGAVSGALAEIAIA
ncbi:MULTISPECIES: capsid cement protein [Actinomycetes]|uniref:capsid cement protein n=1 Tax=Actinomycetes TaxID=1760 RepID=UPI0004C198A9|nr:MULTISPECIES: capsid cement protein [Actinomycetes]